MPGARSVSSGFFAGSVAGSFLAALLLIIAGVELRASAASGLLVASGLLLGVYGEIVFLVLLYQAWASIQDGITPTRPGQAVGFLFIPIFNFYWLFKALPGFAGAYNSYLDRAGSDVPRLKPGPLVALAVCTVLAIVPVAGVVFGPLALLLQCSVASRLCAAVNALATPARASSPFDWERILRGFVVLAAVYALVVYMVPAPGQVTPAGWRLTGIFLAAIVGSILEPVPAGALVLMAVTLTALVRSLTIEQALAGYADRSVWLVIAAFLISRALFNTGMARRIALGFVRAFGRTSLGVTYSLALSDMVLAAAIPSNAARAGGVILPIARSISELYGSHPGATARRLGSYLMAAVYQAVCVSCAMFYTGQASNPLAARLAGQMGYTITWASWLKSAAVPGLVGLAIVPWVVMKLHRPGILRTPEAAAFARRELDAMGPLTLKEWIVGAVFAGVCGLWISSSWSGIDITVTALLGGVVLLLSGVLTWEDVKNERAAWDIFVWYGGFLRMGQALNDFGVTRAFAEGVARYFEGSTWMVLLAAALAIYFYAHYAFASITAHILSMFPAFVAVLLAKGAPIGLVIFAFACLANLSAGLTHYGTTPTPMFFGQNYVPMKEWWRIGLLVSFVNLAIWGTVGFAWWKLIGIW